MSLPPTIISVKDNAPAVLVPGGAFYWGMDEARRDELLQQLGEPPDPVFKTELPRRVANIRDCYIDKFPVTNRQYGDFLKATNHAPPLYWKNPGWNKPDLPVVGISYKDAETYAAWAGKRLPTEEEWERAARGTDERVWPWGNEFDPKRCNSKEWNAGRTTAVGFFVLGASPVGAADMAGNVWEYTSGRWEGYGRAIRGGSYKNPAAYCRCTSRWGMDPDVKGTTEIGFRCVMDLTKARIFGKAQG